MLGFDSLLTVLSIPAFYSNVLADTRTCHGLCGPIFLSRMILQCTLKDRDYCCNVHYMLRVV